MQPLQLQKKVVLGLQHTIAMLGATVMVPLRTNLNPSVALFGAGLATLWPWPQMDAHPASDMRPQGK